VVHDDDMRAGLLDLAQQVRGNDHGAPGTGSQKQRKCAWNARGKETVNTKSGNGTVALEVTLPSGGGDDRRCDNGSTSPVTAAQAQTRTSRAVPGECPQTVATHIPEVWETRN
jgi:hypothetical protein